MAGILLQLVCSCGHNQNKSAHHIVDIPTAYHIQSSSVSHQISTSAELHPGTSITADTAVRGYAELSADSLGVGVYTVTSTHTVNHIESSFEPTFTGYQPYCGTVEI